MLVFCHYNYVAKNLYINPLTAKYFHSGATIIAW
jgi:hypothetical protein